MARLGDASGIRGRLYVDAGEAVIFLGLVERPGVDIAVTIEIGLPAPSASTEVFLFPRRGRLTGVVMLASCHFSFTPYPLHWICSLTQRAQYGFCSSHL